METGADTRALIESCQGLVRTIASNIHRRLPPHVELDDLIAYGQVGLAEAARDFDSGRGGQFSTYAYYRVRGAIYDGLSKMSWFSRDQYKRVRREQMSNEVLATESETSRPAADQPARADREIRWLRDVSRALAVVHFCTGAGGERDQGLEPVGDPSVPGGLELASRREMNERLHRMIDELPPEGAALIRATYFDGLTLQEAGRQLGVSKSWASRLHARALERLARSLRLEGVAN
jgi:RNA polymerase sigma factor for flagellar operon FliA